MIQNEDGSVTLEKGERIDVNREIGWVVEDWLPDDKYDGALVFSGGGRSAGYFLFPYRDPDLLKAG